MNEQAISGLDRKDRPYPHGPSPTRCTRAAGCVLSACIVGLCLLCAAGCPSKTSNDSNSPREQSTDAVGERRETRDERQAQNERRAKPAPSAVEGSDEPAAVARYGYKVIRTYPHDPQAFTQGLVYEDGILYEGTGLYGQSTLSKRNLETGELLKRERLPRRFFGEGITIFRDKIIQLTWKSQTGFVYDKTTLRLLKEFTYPGEGWGITHDGSQLIMSDGTATLRFLDPNTFAETRRVTVRDRGRPVTLLNELEYVSDDSHMAQAPWRGRPALASRGHLGLASSSQNPNATSEPQGQDTLVTEEQGRDALATANLPPPQAKPSHGSIFANIWSSDSVVIIDPATGQVTGRLDLTDLWPRSQRPSSEHVLNGIAWIPETNRLLVTGKLWPRLYEIEIIGQVPANQQ